jgi:superfamily II DNA or RNA helicase
MEPLPFQSEKAKELTQEILSGLSAEKTKIITLQAPTGSGKTLIVTEAIRPILNEAAFIWMSYYPDINSQSSGRLKRYGIPSNNIEEISADAGINHLERGTIYFINFQKLAPGNNLERGGDTITPFRTLLQNALYQGIPIVALIDEAHFGSASRRDVNDSMSILENIICSPEYPINCIIGITATPERFKTLIERVEKHPNNTVGANTSLPKISHETVKEAKLLKHDLDITTAAHTGTDFARHAHTICGNALKEWKQIKLRWAEEDDSIYPLLIIQIPDKFDEDNTQFIQSFCQLYKDVTESDLTPDEIRHCFSGGKSPWEIEYIKPQDIQESYHVKVVFFKSALTTGWDCPRAEMLISLRSAKDQTSIIQLVGRMLRNPKGFQVENPENPDLDIAFLYLPFYDKAVLENIQKEYREGLTGDVRQHAERVTLTWNPKLSDKRERIEEILKTLPTAKRVWKSKNLASRVKELREALISAPLKKENIDTKKLAGMLSSWLDDLKNEIITSAGEQLHRIKGKTKLEGIELQKIRMEMPMARTDLAELDERDERKCFRHLEDRIPKLKEGVSEDILREANRALREDTTKNPDGLKFPILILHGKEKLLQIIQDSVKRCHKKLEDAVEIIRTDLAQSDSKPRREMRALASSLLDIDCTIDYVEWVCPEEQTSIKSDDWVEAPKCIHCWEGKVPPGSLPEQVVRRKMEQDPNVVAYLRNPQKGNGLGIRYTNPNRTDDITFPDFIAIEKTDGGNHQIRIIECKGMEERGKEPQKYRGLADYEKKLRGNTQLVTCEWVEVVDGQIRRARPTATTYEQRCGAMNLL